ncbi:MAG: SidA/IucD/PvdA family monooxygenase [Pseudomonadales bacterium]|nr:SidA/IucD/PvdA family monooxygenase [Pseudomonadales bacterium]
MQQNIKPIHTIVIGAGQAGLCASYHLSQQGIEHLVLERARIGERWRSERWDTLRFQFPNRYVRLPGFPYSGDEPESFMHRDGIVSVIERYAEHIKAPIQCEVDVLSVQLAQTGQFLIDTRDQKFLAENVILATGPYQRTLTPDVAKHLPQGIQQLSANTYTNATALPAGGVLVVGAGGSGVQITEDLLAAGREAWLCVGNFKRIPRSHRGRDIMDWLEELNLTNQPVDGHDPSDHSALLTGVDGGYEVDLRRIVAKGGTLLGRLEGVEGDELVLGNKLLKHMQAAEDAYDEIVRGIETALSERDIGLDPVEARPPPPGPMPPETPTRLSLKDANITSVIWATGYGVDFSWVKCGEYKADGMPLQKRGVSTVPGLYFLGLFFMHSARSSFFWGVGDDAQHVVTHIASNN